MTHLIEPYNAYQKKPLKKKHPTEIAEEEALFIKTMIEEQRITIQEQARQVEVQRQLMADAVKQHLALREAAAQKNLLNQNLALPQYEPQQASQQVQDGQYAAPAGGGGWCSNNDLESIEVASFYLVPSSGYGPLTVAFVNNTRSPDDDTFLWDFGTGSLTSTDASPSSLIYVRTGSFTITLQSTSSVGTMTSTTQELTVLDPTLVASINSPLLASGPAQFSRSFIGTQTYPGGGTVSGLWDFGDGTTYAYTQSATVVHIYDTGSFTASLSLTESGYNHTSTASAYISASVPSLTATLTISTSSNVGPMSASFTASLVYTGNSTLDGKVYDTPGGYRAYTTSPMMFTTVQTTGSFTSSFSVTESRYNIGTTVFGTPWSASVPNLTAAFTFSVLSTDTSSATVFLNNLNGIGGTQYNGNGTLTYLWNLGSGSITSSGIIPTPQIYTVAGPYTASLQVTESSYNFKSLFIRSWEVV